VLRSYILLVPVILTPCIATMSACSPAGKYIDVDRLDDSMMLPPTGYIIGRGDVLNITVLNQPTLGGRVMVRTDGFISFTFVNDVLAAGKSPAELAAHLQTQLKVFLQTPVVTVSVETSKPLNVSVLGEVVRPGSYVIDNGSSVLQALAAAGGLTEFAGSGSILVVRNRPMMRVKVRYPDLVAGRGKSTAFRLQDGDAIVVE
jgi:polysaccharide export outer membrane protein